MCTGVLISSQFFLIVFFATYLSRIINLLLDVLVCSIAAYFVSMFVFCRARKAPLVQIYGYTQTKTCRMKLYMYSVKIFLRAFFQEEGVRLWKDLPPKEMQ